jgi:hypothetical protein
MPGRFRSRTRFLSRFPVSVASPFAETQAPAGRTRARKRTHKIRGEAHTLVKVSTLRTRTAASGKKISSRGKVLRVRSGAKPEAHSRTRGLPLSAVSGLHLRRVSAPHSTQSGIRAGAALPAAAAITSQRAAGTHSFRRARSAWRPRSSKHSPEHATRSRTGGRLNVTSR